MPCSRSASETGEEAAAGGLDTDAEAQRRRRERWYREVRLRIGDFVNPDGRGRIPQFDPPAREPLWILPALYTGGPEHVALANRMVARYWQEAPSDAAARAAGVAERSGLEFGIFQSNVLAHRLRQFGHLATPDARRVMEWHARASGRTYGGSAQPDYKFHGANDNMPMMGAKGLILGGEALGDGQMVRHGHWLLHVFRELLSRSAWASEFNSSTYSAVTLANVAMVGTWAQSAEIRALARQIEHRLWAEMLLHYHPGTRMQAGPHCRAYQIDAVGHNHSLQMLLWLTFGAELTGRDMIASYFRPDGTEVYHFAGCHFQSVAEYCDLVNAEFHVPEELATLIHCRRYPAVLRGRSECMARFDGFAASYHTETHMEEEFSLATVNGPIGGGEQTTSLYVTYKRRPQATTFRDAGTVFVRYFMRSVDLGATERSADGEHEGERSEPNQGWFYALQKANVGLLLSTPNLKEAPLETDALALAVIFPAHYGAIRRSLMGCGPARDGASGECEGVLPVSVEAGEVHIHIQPLLPTTLDRRAALRFGRHGRYEVLQLINYEGARRSFTRNELQTVLNGLVLTVSPRSRWGSLDEFHARHSDCLVTDYFMAGHRFFRFVRKDVRFDVVLTPDPFGVQTEAVDGRHVPRPVFESNQIEVARLPFMSGPVEPSFPWFPWGDRLDICWYPELPWLVGSRGLAGEASYSARTASSDGGGQPARGAAPGGGAGA